MGGMGVSPMFLSEKNMGETPLPPHSKPEWSSPLHPGFFSKGTLFYDLNL